MEEWLRIGANIASILTSIIAAGASIVFWANKRSKRTRLERYLKAKKRDLLTSLFRLRASWQISE